MSLYRYKGSKVWTMDFMFHGQRIRETTRQTSITRAREVELKRKNEIRESAANIRKRRAPLLLLTASEEWIKLKTPQWSGKMLTVQETSLSHLLPVLGKKLLVDIDAADVSAYQKLRIKSGASPRTTNIEVGTLRSILRRHGIWALLQPDVKMLETRDDVGKAITPTQEASLLRECARSRSRALLPFITLAIETGARYNVLRTLQWGSVDLKRAAVQFGKDKTAAGTGRIVPLNGRAVATLKFWAQQFPNREPSHYVFPAEKYGAAGDEFTAKSYATDPTRPIGDLKKAWQAAKKRTQRHCPHCQTGLLSDVEKGYRCTDCRFLMEKLAPELAVRIHDLRHTFVSRLLDAGVPLTKVAKLVGWSAGTMVLMAKRYGHFGLDELRSAVETATRTQDESYVKPKVKPIVRRQREMARPN